MAASRAGSAASAAISAASRSGVNSACGETDRAARVHQHAGVGELVLVERMRQRHQDRGPADRGELGDRRGAGARDHQMAAAMRAGRSGKNGATSASTLKPGIGLADARHVLLARLLHDLQPHLQARLEPLDRGRHDVGHHRAPWLPPNTSRLKRPAGVERRIGRRRGREHRRPHRIAGVRRLRGERRRRCRGCRQSPSRSRRTRGASIRLARPITAFCSWITVGMPRSVAASSGGSVG